MRRFAPLAVLATLATPLAAQEMTPDERATFRSEIRAYLLENPEVLMEFQGNISTASLGRMSDAFGLDHDAVTNAMNGPDVAAVLAENSALANALAITGTPSFVFEDQMLRGYVPLNQMEQIVAQLRSRDG